MCSLGWVVGNLTTLSVSKTLTNPQRVTMFFAMDSLLTCWQKVSNYVYSNGHTNDSVSEIALRRRRRTRVIFCAFCDSDSRRCSVIFQDLDCESYFLLKIHIVLRYLETKAKFTIMTKLLHK